MATIFLDGRLVICSFTPAAAKVFKILPTDRGRPITDLSSSLNLTEFATDIQRVFAGRGPLERRVESKDQATHFLLRLAPYQDIDKKIDGVVVTFIDVTRLTRSELRQHVLIGELQHRTRNLLAIVQSIARQTLGDSRSIVDFVDRLAALSRVQRLIGDAAEERIALMDLVRLELTALGGADALVTVSGAAVGLGPAVIQTIGLALHELATNAVKYGALKDNRGRLEISWQVDRGPEGRRMVFLWREMAPETLQPPSRKGFGRELIEDALVYTLRARSELQFRPDGVICRIDMPLQDHEGEVQSGIDGSSA